MQLEKPITDKVKERCKIIVEYLKLKDYVTKKELCFVLGFEMNESNERRVRDLVSLVSKYYPIISTSDSNKGYKLAKYISDLEDVEHSWKELDSRMEDMALRRKPLIKFFEKHKQNTI